MDSSVGETGRSIETHVKKRKHYLNSGQISSVVVAYRLEVSHSILFEVILVIAKSCILYGRRNGEAIEIHKYLNNIKREDKHHLPALSKLLLQAPFLWN
ncbi:hypothetical protein Trydic_g18385 [Trypoxylus dichotomus]